MGGRGPTLFDIVVPVKVNVQLAPASSSSFNACHLNRVAHIERSTETLRPLWGLPLTLMEDHGIYSRKPEAGESGTRQEMIFNPRTRAGGMSAKTGVTQTYQPKQLLCNIPVRDR